MKLLSVLSVLLTIHASHGTSSEGHRPKKQVKRAPGEELDYGGDRHFNRPVHHYLTPPQIEGGFVGIQDHGDHREKRKPPQEEHGRQIRGHRDHREIRKSPHEQHGRQIGGASSESHNQGGGNIFQGGINGFLGGSGGSHGSHGGNGLLQGGGGFQVGSGGGLFEGGGGSQGGSGDSGGFPIFSGNVGSGGSSESGGPSYPTPSNIDGPGGLDSDVSGQLGGLGGAFGGGYGIGLGGLIFGGPQGPVFAGNSAFADELAAGDDEDSKEDEGDGNPPRPFRVNYVRRPYPQNGLAQNAGHVNQRPQSQLSLSGTRPQFPQTNHAGGSAHSSGTKSSRLPRPFGDVAYIAFIFPKRSSSKGHATAVKPSTSHGGAPTVATATAAPRTKTVTKTVPYPVPVTISRPAPFFVPIPVGIPVDRPFPVPVPRTYALQVLKPYPIEVPKPVSVPVQVPVVENLAVKVPAEVHKTYNVQVPVILGVNSGETESGHHTYVESSLHSSWFNRRADRTENSTKRSTP